VIATPVDFVGLNVYLPGSYFRSRDDAPAAFYASLGDEQKAQNLLASGLSGVR
jgi:hypothetical protein